MEKSVSDWKRDPLPRPPFVAFESEGKASVMDQEGRILTHDLRAMEFVRELANVMNENSERLVNAWKKDVSSRKG